MKKNYKFIIGILFSLLLVLCISVVYLNRYAVYFYDASDGERYRIATMYFNYNEIEVKDRWFKDFDGEVSGIIVIENEKQYATIPYSSLTDFPYEDNPDYSGLEALYNNNHFNSKGLSWVKKTSDYEVELEFSNWQNIWVSVDETSSDRTIYGNGVYKVPIYQGDGDLYYHLIFIHYGSPTRLEGFADGVPSYVLEQFTYVDATITDEYGSSQLFMPVTFHGGLSAKTIESSTNYYYSYNNHMVIMEAITYYID